ncbi:LysR family transcriptional regulator [Cochlodiniinecator piscidefendens]|uniref:LysR family transcriptional regulator n=1 Tax=Cochlodiniinecator piscidefendens TaxID=2715756 RepID=UPI00140CB2BC|nr:LysR family transcriptional regulator [Cochlodiniinecator piscidefendens]
MSETNLDWADLKLFLAVARGRGLAGGATISGLSPPSLGRHMTRLERTIGEVLFLRKPRGYELTEAGQELLAETEATEMSILAIERRISRRSAALPVNISAGTWMTHFLTQHIAEVAQPDIRLAFCPDETVKNIGRREATIALRNVQPDEPAAFARKTTRVAFAPYATEAGENSGNWIASTLRTPSANWVQAHQTDNISVRVSHPRTLLDLAIQGAGQVVLPCFIGDSEPGLIRMGDIIPALTHDQWLVVHGEDREFSAVRTTIDALVGVIRKNRALFEGRLSA